MGNDLDAMLKMLHSVNTKITSSMGGGKAMALYNSTIRMHIPEISVPDDPYIGTFEEAKKTFSLIFFVIDCAEDLDPALESNSRVSTGRSYGYLKVLINGFDAVGVQFFEMFKSRKVMPKGTIFSTYPASSEAIPNLRVDFNSLTVANITYTNEGIFVSFAFGGYEMKQTSIQNGTATGNVTSSLNNTSGGAQAG